MPPKVMAVIPARSGSKSIPNKNIRDIGGFPLIAWSIAAAREARLVDRVVVSTDSRQYADTAIAYGAEAPFLRPAEFSRDASADIEFVLHLLGWLRENGEEIPDYLLHLRPPCPNRAPEIIDQAIEAILADSTATSLLCAHPVDYPPCKYYRMGNNGEFVGYMGDEFVNLPRQMCVQGYRGNGYADLMSVKSLLETRHLYGSRRMAFVTPNPGDIDTESEFVEMDAQLHRGESPLRRYLENMKTRFVVPAEREEITRKGEREKFPGFRPQLIVFDFDGVFTDNIVYVDEHGKETVRCHRGDGLGIAMLRKAGYPMLILSTETNPVVAARGRKLQIPVIQGCGDKKECLAGYMRKEGIDPARVVYIGDDVNDLEAMQLVGCRICPANAHPTVKGKVDVMLTFSGGCGAVREFCEKLMGIHHE